ncbi:MAG TPA: SRPBCC domain-containing protein, partial [Pirellulales bacterium]
MRSVIQQRIVLPASTERLFEMYMDPQAHAAFTGHPVTIGSHPGDPFAAFGGQLSGATIAVVRPKLIVQSWRSVVFKPDDADSTLILSFSPEADDAAGRP